MADKINKTEDLDYSKMSVVELERHKIFIEDYIDKKENKIDKKILKELYKEYINLCDDRKNHMIEKQVKELNFDYYFSVYSSDLKYVYDIDWEFAKRENWEKNPKFIDARNNFERKVKEFKNKVKKIAKENKLSFNKLMEMVSDLS